MSEQNQLKVENKQLSALRGIRSFVLRQGHLSHSQEKALQELLPVWGIEYQTTTIDLNKLFLRDNNKVLEIGFGMGAATAEIAQRLPDIDFLAIDVHAPGVGNLLKLIDEQDTKNIRVMRHDAVEVVDNMLADNSLAGVHIFFPDPWPKKRHHKRRLIQQPFIEKLIPKLKIGAYIHLATDWQEYAEHMLETLNHCEALSNTATDYAPKPDYRPETKFERRGINLGHGVWDLIFTRIA